MAAQALHMGLRKITREITRVTGFSILKIFIFIVLVSIGLCIISIIVSILTDWQPSALWVAATSTIVIYSILFAVFLLPLLLGFYYVFIKRDYARAIANYTKAIQRNPKYAAAYNKRGDAYRAQDDYARAIADYTQAIQLDPEYAIAYSNRGNAYRAQDDFDRAIADYTQAIQLDPEDDIAYSNRGKRLSCTGRL